MHKQDEQRIWQLLAGGVENTSGAAIRLSKTVKTGEGQQRDTRPDDN